MTGNLYLEEHLDKYPQMQPQDIVKLCYQAANGAEHLLLDPKAAERYFKEEYESVPAKEGVLFDKISPEICRVHLAAWKASRMPEMWLLRMFVLSAEQFSKDEGRLEQYLEEASEAVKNKKTAFTKGQWEQYLEDYRKVQMPAVHHSETFRSSVHPSYRIISSRFLCIFPVLQALADLSKRGGTKVIALDGRAASGKTTRAQLLKMVLGAEVIHMDDFFLPPQLRTQERLQEAGGNVHYERFEEEVLPYLSNAEAFSYRIFDCGRMDYHGNRKIETSEWRIVEGSYSHHPQFGTYADLSVFCTIDEKEQMARITKRNGERMAQVFQERWIPLEEKYFAEYHIMECSDLIV